MKLQFYTYSKTLLKARHTFGKMLTSRVAIASALACASVVVGAMSLAQLTHQDNFVSSVVKQIIEKKAPSVKNALSANLEADKTANSIELAQNTAENSANATETASNTVDAATKLSETTALAPPPPPCTNCCNLVRNGGMDGNYAWTTNGGWSSGTIYTEPATNLYLAQTITNLNSGPTADQVTLTFDLGGSNWLNNGYGTLDVMLNGTKSPRLRTLRTAQLYRVRCLMARHWAIFRLSTPTVLTKFTVRASP
jgi:hypothetical protein